ncbi:MAG TPA: DUF3048 domain-containing protein [Anaerolineae bacterium]|nr:DUF3048 domain-containing protein [Anaerolineae bacterium]HQK15576.1 DUF3048 domain-containing protein [Anaerolineae bacterium]
MYKQIRYFGLFCLIALFVVGCGTPTPPAATPTPTRTPAPRQTATPVPTATATPVPPTPTATATSTPAAPVVTPFPPDVNPLTGEKMESAEVLDRIPIAIKVSNDPRARPQSGLNSADLVFEHLTEGNVTRFTAIFYSKEPEETGSVRSGRLIDLEIPAMYHALFGYSGSSAGVKERIRNSDLFPTYIAAPDFGVGQPYFYRVPQGEGKLFEDTLFTNPTVLRQLAEERGVNARPEFPRLMAFSEKPLEGGTPINYFEINYQSSCTAEWTYDAASGRWKRATAGVAQTDYLTGDPLTAANIIIVYAHHVETDFWEQMSDKYGWIHSIEIQLWGTGPALVFRDGVMINGYWERLERTHMLTFWVSEGHPIPLKPGNTWFQLVPLGTTSEEIKAGQLRFTPAGIVPFGQ